MNAISSQSATIKMTYKPYTLNFIEPGGTSRGVMITRKIWIVFLENEKGDIGIGECAPLAGLSYENINDIESVLDTISRNPEKYISNLSSLVDFPSIRFALEMANLDLQNRSDFTWYPSEFRSGNDHIKINGLIWMGTKDKMVARVKEKLEQGFTCLKFKIGALNFEEEYDLIKSVRKEFDPSVLEIRVDANGAYSFDKAKNVISSLYKLGIHSIEQPLKAGNIEDMSRLCNITDIPIALDEELIGVHKYEERNLLIQTIKPQYIILKPSLTGGFASSEEWISIAERNGAQWWITSALESNVGLNAIAQWTYSKNNKLPQGLGTGKLFSNNLPGAIYTKGEKIFIDKTFDKSYLGIKLLLE